MTNPTLSVPDNLLSQLESICTTTTTEDALTEAARDWWPLISWHIAQKDTPSYRPLAVCRPLNTGEVSQVLKLCNSAKVPVTPFGGRSGVCGGSLPVFGGISLDLRGMSGIVSMDNTSLLIEAKAGTFGHVLEGELRSREGLTLGHWPQSIEISTLGGWLACRSAGQYSTRYGKIEDMVRSLEVVLADGTVIRTGGHAPRSATGPDLTQLFVGSEGTLGIITQAELSVHRLAKAQESKVFAWSSFEKGLVASRQILQRGATPAVLRLYDSIESSRNFSLGYGSEIPPGSCLMIVIDEGDAEIVQATMGIVTQECHEAVGMNTSLADHWLQHRNDVSILDTLLEAGVVVDTVEIAAKWIQLPSIYSEILDKLSGLDGILVASAHQSHAYTDGACLYFTFGGQEPSPRQVSSVPLIKPSNIQWANHFYKTAWESIMDTVIQHQGAISHHHGIGLLRAPWLAKSLGNSMEVLATLKKSLDPNGILNPGKLGLSSSFGDEVDLPLPFGKIYPRS